ncbi:MAG TPA: type II toxin-antitoxin system RelE/ParE family toxin [Myxococcota bacterium]|nr:type II toxin-antitoxin system RelE/ParE family toxin [Myxococcota bacterium]
MAGYRLLIKTSARKELEAVGPARVDRQRVVRRIEGLAEVPRPSGCEKLRGSDDRYRIRQGRYRVIYEVDDLAKVVTVVKLGHRRDVYR